jgi:hypothetical protein
VIKTYPLDASDVPSPVLAIVVAKSKDNSEKLLWANSVGLIKVGVFFYRKPCPR